MRRCAKRVYIVCILRIVCGAVATGLLLGGQNTTRVRAMQYLDAAG